MRVVRWQRRPRLAVPGASSGAELRFSWIAFKFSRAPARPAVLDYIFYFQTL